MAVGLRIREAAAGDVAGMVALSAAKRTAYESVQPGFWTRAPDADGRQSAWFAQLVSRAGAVTLVAESGGTVVGFVIATDTPIPPVYKPAGKVFTIDDFCVATPERWSTVGRALVDEARRRAKAAGASQMVVVCGAHDAEKRALLRSAGLAIASEWYVGPA